MKIKNLALVTLAAMAAALASAADETATNVTPATNAPITLPAGTPGTTVLSLAPASPATNTVDAAETNDATGITVTNAVRMNFHNVPLSAVLNYLSAKMGFSVVSEVDVRGNATIVSQQPIGTNEVLDLLSGALAKNNYSVSRNGQILTITTADAAKNGAETPVKQASSPDQVPVNDQIATYILPVHTLNPTQLIKDLDQLIPTGATVAANEAGNAIIMTARQRDIHRFSEIINALDSSSVSDVEVFVLRYADAKSVAAELKDVFQSPDASGSKTDSSRQRFRGNFPGGGGFPGFGGESGSSAESKNAANKAVFTSDDQMNAVIASAPPDFFPMITNVIARLDQASQDITVVKLFHLKYADPQETADELSNLFPDDSKNNDASRSLGFRFNPFIPQQPSAASAKSERMTRQTTVRAVPDPRTATLVVTASKEQMEQITQMIEELDSNPAMVQHVHTYSLNNADPATVQAAMAAMFSGANTKAATSSQNASALGTRANNAAQAQTPASTTGFGTSGTGTTGAH